MDHAAWDAALCCKLHAASYQLGASGRNGREADIAVRICSSHIGRVWQVPDIRSLWALGAALLVLGGIGILAVGTLVGLPIILGATALQVPLTRLDRVARFKASVICGQADPHVEIHNLMSTLDPESRP